MNDRALRAVKKLYIRLCAARDIARVYDQGTAEEFESNANAMAQVGINAQMPSTTILTMLSGYTMGNRRER
jgi:hypothetical protein